MKCCVKFSIIKRYLILKKHSISSWRRIINSNLSLMLWRKLKQGSWPRWGIKRINQKDTMKVEVNIIITIRTNLNRALTRSHEDKNHNLNQTYLALTTSRKITLKKHDGTYMDDHPTSPSVYCQYLETWATWS